MRTHHLILREILHRKLNFALALLAVIIAVAAVVASLTLLRAHDVQTEALLTRKQEQLDERVKELDDQMRVITKRLGFNVQIFPQGINRTDPFAKDYLARYMPEQYATRLAESKIATIRHVLPSLEQLVRWPERDDRSIFLVGIRDEVHLSHRKPSEPLAEAVPKGEIILGHRLAESEGLKLGDQVQLLGETFTVAKIHPPRLGNQDLTAWVDLQTAQQMTGKEDLINGLWALECKCAWADVDKVRAEIAGILPDVEVLEKESIAKARRDARDAASREGQLALEQEQTSRAALREQRSSLAAVIVPLIVIASGASVGLLMLLNVRDRRYEIGVLGALGVRPGQIMGTFLGKALIIGLVGATIGYLAGAAVGVSVALAWDKAPSSSPLLTIMPGAVVALSVLVLAPLLAAGASWLPAVIAAGQDPAAILSQE